MEQGRTISAREHFQGFSGFIMWKQDFRAVSQRKIGERKREKEGKIKREKEGEGEKGRKGKRKGERLTEKLTLGQAG